VEEQTGEVVKVKEEPAAKAKDPPAMLKNEQGWRKELQKYVGKLVGAASELTELAERMTGKHDVSRKQKMRVLSLQMQQLVQSGLDTPLTTPTEKGEWIKEASTAIDESKDLVKQARALLK
jgi:hypothetical protein